MDGWMDYMIPPHSGWIDGWMDNIVMLFTIFVPLHHSTYSTYTGGELQYLTYEPVQIRSQCSHIILSKHINRLEDFLASGSDECI